jgi:hypothetical protein
MRNTLLTLFALLVASTSMAADDVTAINLSGEWVLQYGDTETVVTLPGTMDTNQQGTPIEKKDETTHLSRLFSYQGAAEYQRLVDIPKTWKKREVTLFLERTKFTEVFVDGHFIGSCNDISTPQRYHLGVMKPGRHMITIKVDNSRGVPEQLYANSHAYTEDTQTNWNGIIGIICLTLSDENGDIRKVAKPCDSTEPDEIGENGSTLHPNFVNFHIEGHHFYANGHRIFLRGKHDACVWPMTGHVAMDTDSWRKYLQTCADYGINHIRFHSWCPPEACFEIADEMGIILQPELPFWGDFNPNDSILMSFLQKEGRNILREYGQHPSFRMFALGNELWGSIEKMADFIAEFRKIAPDKVYTFGSNFYLGYQGVKPGMDYFTTCRIGGEAWGSYNTHTRGSFSFADAYQGGMINTKYPNSSMNFDEACDACQIPVISHETGQFQTYPDYNEIKKYTGVLYPYNMEVFRERLKKAGMLAQAADFHRASGRWSTLLYKADIEMDLRTRNMAGFQLLDIQDYPGQGSAYVGILDAFMESKGITTPAEWRQWCSEVVPLFVSEKFCFATNEPVKGRLQIANYGGKSLKGMTLSWLLLTKAGEIVGQGSTEITTDGEGLIDVGSVTATLSSLNKAEQLQLNISIDKTEYRNSYDLWAYPADNKLAPLKRNIIITNTMTDEIGKKLEQGARVLLMPTIAEEASSGETEESSLMKKLTVGPLFQTDYWNYRMFKTISEKNNKHVSPGTLGILCNPGHPLLRDFPTEEHTNWQWFPVIKESHPFMLDNTSTAYSPIVQVIDNIERNHKLGLVFEFFVGKGRLLVCMSNLEKASEYVEGRQFYSSVLSYMQSNDFKPQTHITLSDLHKLFTTPVVEGKIGELNNISPY